MRLAVVVLLWCFHATLGLIVHQKTTEPIKTFTYQTFSGVAMYATNDAPASGPPGDGSSHVDLHLKFHRDQADRASSPNGLEVVLIPDIHIEDIGLTKDGKLHLCCTDDLFSQNICPQKNELIVKKGGIPGLQRTKVTFAKNEKDTEISKVVPISKTHIHVFAISSCDNNLGSVSFSGDVVWMNPYGHLPGDLYGYLPFYGWMCVVYLCVAAFWFCLNAFHWKELLYVQNCITGVLALCLIEMATWYFDYLHMNNQGYRHKGPFILGLVVSVTRRTVSRMLVVAVSMGYGVVKPTLGPVGNKILALGCIYWIFAFMFEALIHYSQTEKVSTVLRAILIPPVAVLDGVFWWWIFVSLNKTIDQLKVRKQSAKLTLYRRFTIVLSVSLLVAMGFSIYQMYFVFRKLYFADWERLWFMEVGFWQILFSVVFFSIMFLWRPSDHSKTYAYSSQLVGYDDSDDEDDVLEMVQPDTVANDDAPRFTIDDEDPDEDEAAAVKMQ